MKRTMWTVATAWVALLALAGCSGAAQQGAAGTASGDGAAKGGEERIVNVVKLVGVGWFDRMEVGLKDFTAATGVSAIQTGAEDASPEKQVKVVQDLLASNPTAITVVPNSPESLENVLARAQDAGIVVVTHEAPGQEHTDADIEAFNNLEYGALIMDNLAQCMGDEGTYAAFVGSLTASTHVEWVRGALERAEESFPGITRVAEPLESKEDESVAYEKTKELLAKYPELRGIQGSAGTDVAGAARAVAEAGLADQVCVMGTSIPSVSAKYIEDGSVDKIFFWDPARAGEAMAMIAHKLAAGETIKDGTDLGIAGYESLRVDPDNPKVFYGDAAVTVDKSNIDQYDF